MPFVFYVICELFSVVMVATLYVILSIHPEPGAVIVMKSHDDNELPGPPSKPQVTDVTKNSVSLSWQSGIVGASPVSSFVIEAFRFVLPLIPNSNLLEAVLDCVGGTCS